MLAAIYTRVSTERQEENYSLATQLAACRQYAETHGFTIIAEYKDVESGAVLDRSGLKEVRLLIAHKQIAALIAYTPDRLSRNLAHSLLVRDEARQADVAIHYAAKGKASETTPEGELFENIESAFAEFERLKIRERMARGKRGKAESGRPVGNGNAPFGYRFEGQGRERQLVIQADEARVVRQIFTWYVHESMSTVQITDRLTEFKIPTAGDGKQAWKRRGQGVWARATVVGILKNTTYMGVYYAYRLKTVNGREVRRDRTEWVPITVESIVDQIVWDAAQQKLAQGRALASRHSKHFYLVGRRIRCSCGYAATGVQAKVYRCVTQGSKDTIQRCTLPRFSAKAVDQTVWNYIEASLNRDRILAGIQAQQESRADQQRTLQDQRELLLKQRTDLDAQLMRLLDLYVVGTFDQTILEERKVGIEAARLQVDAELADVAAQFASPEPSQAEIDALIAYADELSEELAYFNDTKKRRIVDLLRTKVVLVVVEGQKYVDVSGVLSVDPVRLPIVTTASQSGSRCLPAGAEYCCGAGTPQTAPPAR